MDLFDLFDRIALLIVPVLLIAFVGAILVQRLRAGRCPHCGRWRVTISGPIHPAERDRQPTMVYKCGRCRHTWLKPADR